MSQRAWAIGVASVAVVVAGGTAVSVSRVAPLDDFEVIETKRCREAKLPRDPLPGEPAVAIVPKEMAADHNESCDDASNRIKGDSYEFTSSVPGTAPGVESPVLSGEGLGMGAGSGGRYGGRSGGRRNLVVRGGGGPAEEPPPTADEHGAFVENGWKQVAEAPRSTFSIDVDRASYAIVRRYLTQQRTLPPADAVRVEELLNYFEYQDAPPSAGSPHPFSVNVEVAGCPWNEAARLVRIGLKGRVLAAEQRPAANLVFLIDVSGSMQRPDRLPLVVESLQLLTRHLNARDQIAIVVYAGASGLVLPITSCDQKGDIEAALGRLSAGGSTNGGAGIELAYAVAGQGFIACGTNRVVLCTDGDFNVGLSDNEALTRLIAEKARSRVFLSVLGFGMGNLKDGRLEKLADRGNGNYGYVDSIREAKKLLVDELSGTLVAIAKDVKIQVELNPARVQSYRLIGYENRKLAARDFNDDQKDAGEIGAGHAVTALYEVIPVAGSEPGVDPLRYQTPAQPGALTPAAGSGELLNVKLRYKQPEGDVSALLEVPVRDAGASFEQASQDLRWAAGVAAFGMVLRRSEHKGTASLELAERIASASLGEDASGYRRECLGLIATARRLQGR